MIKQWLKNRWENSRITLGYYLWAGVPMLSIFFWMLGYPKDWVLFGVSHFIGLYIVSKYHWFAKDTKDERRVE